MYTLQLQDTHRGHVKIGFADMYKNVQILKRQSCPIFQLVEAKLYINN